MEVTVQGKLKFIGKQTPNTDTSTVRTTDHTHVLDTPTHRSPHPLLDMSLRSEGSPFLPRLGGNLAVIFFVLILVAFVVESQLTQVRALFYSIDSRSSSPHLYSMCKAPFASGSLFSSCASLTRSLAPVDLPLTDFFAAT
jgi:hypothetical protein